MLSSNRASWAMLNPQPLPPKELAYYSPLIRHNSRGIIIVSTRQFVR